MNEDVIHIVQQYLTNQLPPEEKTAFEQRLTEDQDFAEAATKEAALFIAIQKEGDRVLEEKLNIFSKELLDVHTPTLSLNQSGAKVRKMSSYSRIVYAAAALIGLIVIALPLWLMDRPGGPMAESPEEIYATNFTIPPAPEARSEGSRQAWRQAFAEGDYKTTVMQLEGLLADATFTGRSEAFHYLGIAQLALGNTEAALQALQQVRSDSFDWESAQWYSALALLQLNKPDEAKPLLTSIANQASHPQQQQAKEILDQL